MMARESTRTRTVQSTQHHSTQPRLDYTLALKKHEKICKANPEFFDMARRVLRSVDNGENLLLSALVLGLQEAFEMGAKGTMPEQDPEMRRYRDAPKPHGEENEIDCKYGRETDGGQGSASAPRGGAVRRTRSRPAAAPEQPAAPAAESRIRRTRTR